MMGCARGFWIDGWVLLVVNAAWSLILEHGRFGSWH